MKEACRCLAMGDACPAGCWAKPLTQVKAFMGLWHWPICSSFLPVSKDSTLDSCLEFSHPEASVAAAFTTWNTTHCLILGASKHQLKSPWIQIRRNCSLLWRKVFGTGWTLLFTAEASWGVCRISPLSYIPTHAGTGLCLMVQSLSLALKICCSVKLFTVWLIKNMMKTEYRSLQGLK